MAPERDSSGTNAGVVGSNGRRAASSGHERDYDEDHGDNQQHMSNPGRFSSHTAGTERFGYQSNDQKNDCVS
jgi:thiamine biosynthesis lipoprotein ApbE